jgi:transposase
MFQGKGLLKYIISALIDKETDEIYECANIHFIDEERIEKEEKFDGYYAIITSELEMPNQKILDAYRNLWKIEETFKITKSELKTRSVYLSKKEHIEAHFLTCFVSLLLLRLIQINTNEKYSTKTLVNEMKSLYPLHYKGYGFFFSALDEKSKIRLFFYGLT